ncbi:MAG TPA: ABC transporter permease [Limnochordales bacterium]
MLRHPRLMVGGALLLMMTAAAVVAPWLTPYDPEAVNPQERLLPPGEAHPMGTDRYGRDVFSRVVYGARTSLLVGWSVMLGVTLLGGGLGLLASVSPRADRILMRVVDGMMAFPDVLLAIALMAVLGSNVVNVIAALTVVYTPRMARVVRAAALSVLEEPYIEAARAAGAAPARVLWRHVLPGTIPAAVVQATFLFAYAVLAEAALSFLGVGAPPYVPSWGNIINEGQLYVRRAAWIVIYPGVAVVLTVLGLNMIGDDLRDWLDPRMRSEREKN